MLSDAWPAPARICDTIDVSLIGSNTLTLACRGSELAAVASDANTGHITSYRSPPCLSAPAAPAPQSARQDLPCHVAANCGSCRPLCLSASPVYRQQVKHPPGLATIYPPLALVFAAALLFDVLCYSRLYGQVFWSHHKCYIPDLSIRIGSVILDLVNGC
jgi:hypothetical protein